MKMNWLRMACVVGGVWLMAIAGGCDKSSYLDQRTTPARAQFGNEVINLAALPPIVVTRPAGAPAEPEEPRGNWTFTVPTTVTREERKTAQMIEVSLYMGRPGPNDLPFLVITTSRDRTARCERDAAFKIQQQRDYSMAGNIVHEWTGLTTAGAGFSELLIRRPGATETAQVCHAIAIARNEEEQKLALTILGSIVWTPAP
jgi:hypothetical protein